MSDSQNIVLAPATGLITELCEFDKHVEEGDTIGQLESMKTLIDIVAPVSGVIKWVIDRCQSVNEAEMIGFISGE